MSEPTTSAVRKRVLLIDDEPLLLKSIARMIRSDHDTVLAFGGDKALETLAEDSNYDAIICDLMMPKVDGVQIYAALEESYPKLVPKLIFLSGGVFHERMTSFLEERELTLLDKPVGRVQLLEAIAAVG